MSNIFSEAGRIVRLATDQALFGSLAALLTKPEVLKKVTDGKTLVEFLDDGGVRFKRPEIKQAFTEAGLGTAYDTVADNIESVLVAVDTFEAKPVAKLLNRIDTYADPDGTSNPGEIVWKILDGSTPAAAGDPNLTFGLGASAALELEAGDRWPFARDIQDDAELATLFRISAAGTVTATAGAKIPFTGGKLTLGADTKGQTRLSYFFHIRNRGTLFAQAAADSLVEIGSPFSFDEMWSRLTTTDLKGVVLKLDGSFSTTAEFAVAAGAELTKGVKLDATLGVNASIKRAANLELSLRAIGPTGASAPQVRVVVSRGTAHSSSLGSDLAVTLDASGLAARISDAVDAELGKWDAKLAGIRPLLNPGTYLQTKAADFLGGEIAGLVADQTLVAALTSDMRAALGIGTAGQTASWLESRVAAAITHQADKVHQGANNAADAVFAVLQPDIPQFLAADAQGGETKVKALISSLIDHYTNDATTKARELFEAPGASVNALLGELGVAVKGAVDDADKAFAAVRALFDRYDVIVARIRELAIKSATVKLQTEFTIEEGTGSGSDVLITGTFKRGSAQARLIYDTLLSGDLGRVERLLAAGDTADFSLDRASSWAARDASWQLKTGFRLAVFSIATDETRLLRSDATIRLDGNGDITVRSIAAVKDEFDRPSGKQILSFNSAFALSVASSGTAKERAFSASLTIDRAMKKVSRQDVNALLQDLADHGLISAGAVAAATAQIGRWANSHGATSAIPADVKIGLAIDRDGLVRMMRLADRIAVDQRRSSLNAAGRAAVISTVLRGLAVTGAFPDKQIAAAERVARSELKARDATAHLDRIGVFELFAETKGPNDGSTLPLGGVDGYGQSDAEARADLIYFVGGDDLSRGQPVRGSALRFIDAIAALGNVWLSTPQGSPAQPGQWLETDYRNAGKTVAEGMAVWLTQPFLLSKWARLRPELIAGLLVLGELTGQLVIGAAGAGGILHLQLSTDSDSVVIA